MKRLNLFVLFVIISLFFLPFVQTVVVDAQQTAALQLQWAVREGGPAYPDDDRGVAIARGPQGNIYVAAHSLGVRSLPGPEWSLIPVDWGAILAYDHEGKLLWEHEIEGAPCDIAVDGRGGIFVAAKTQTSDYLTVKLSLQGSEEWRAVYSGPNDADDRPTALVVDRLGNVIVTGYSEGDYLTVKYSRGGAQLWEARSEADPGGLDVAAALALDSKGDVYVTGSGDYDLYTVRYSGKTGSQIWSARYGKAADVEAAHDLALDPSGNVFVVGNVWGNGNDYMTIKYDNNGVQQWVRTYSGALEWGNDQAEKVTVDKHGNVYVSGVSENLDIVSYDIATLKYNKGGKLLWEMRHPGSLVDIAVDGSGNAYLAGSEGKNVLLLKYDQSGNELWTVSYDGPGGREDSASALIIDNVGNTWLTGVTWTDSNDAVTLAYTSRGALLWSALCGHYGYGADSAVDIVLDAQGNVLVTGTSQGENKGDFSYPFYSMKFDDDILTVKYDSSGNEIWHRRFDGGMDDRAVRLGVDSSGNVVVLGTIEQGDPYVETNFLTLKYDSSGQLLWKDIYDGSPYNSQEDTAADLAIGPQGDIFVAGTSWSGFSKADITTIRYSSEGQRVWVSTYNSLNNVEDHATAMKVDATGNVYVTGYSADNDGYFDCLTIKYDADGKLQWAKRYEGSSTPSGEQAFAIALDASSNVYVTGYSSGKTITIKYDAEGNQKWVKEKDGDLGAAIALDPLGNVYVTARYVGPGGTYDIRTISYDSAGNERFAVGYDGPSHLDELPTDLGLDSNGNIFVVGKSGMDALTLKYDVNGNLLWSDLYDSPEHGLDAAAAITLDNLGSIFITGVSWGHGYDFLTLRYSSQ